MHCNRFYGGPKDRVVSSLVKKQPYIKDCLFQKIQNATKEKKGTSQKNSEKNFFKLVRDYNSVRIH